MSVAVERSQKQSAFRVLTFANQAHIRTPFPAALCPSLVYLSRVPRSAKRTNKYNQTGARRHSNFIEETRGFLGALSLSNRDRWCSIRCDESSRIICCTDQNWVWTLYHVLVVTLYRYDSGRSGTGPRRSEWNECRSESESESEKGRWCAKKRERESVWKIFKKLLLKIKVAARNLRDSDFSFFF